MYATHWGRDGRRAACGARDGSVTPAMGGAGCGLCRAIVQQVLESVKPLREETGEVPLEPEAFALGTRA